MRSAAYVGRVGGLAVALGIGVPPVVWGWRGRLLLIRLIPGRAWMRRHRQKPAQPARRHGLGVAARHDRLRRW
jgi:hypothetical protein